MRSKTRMSPLRRLAVGEPLTKPKKPGEMNRLEAAYAAHLDQQGLPWLYERISLVLTHGKNGVKGHRYLFDFFVFTPDGVELHEVKGHRRGQRGRQRGINSFKVAAEMFPQFKFFLAEFKSGKWVVKGV